MKLFQLTKTSFKPIAFAILCLTTASTWAKIIAVSNTFYN